MDKTIKILCVCEMGNVRSVGTRRRLNRRKYTNVIAIGCKNTEIDTLKMLCDWADIILVAEIWMEENLPAGISKIDKRFRIGPDVYGNPINVSLQDKIKEQLNKIGLK